MYKPSDIAFVVPTRNRPEKIRNLLVSLVNQTRCGRIVIVDSGEPIQDVIDEFFGKLPVEYHRCSLVGQIAQRNHAISLLDEATPLVGSLDDDIVIEFGAIESICDFWNRAEPETAGVGFNIVNQVVVSAGLAQRATLQTSLVRGRVLKSGTTSDYHGTLVDLRTEWLCGGATTWRLEILRQFLHEPIRVRWAIGEDLIFSYPIGARYPLYVCAAAKVRHEHVCGSFARPAYYHGLIHTLMRYHFILKNDSLSWWCFAYSVLTAAFAKLLFGILLFRLDWLQFSGGQLHGIVGGTWALLLRRDFPDYIASVDEKCR